jgi:hypothetical protein
MVPLPRVMTCKLRVKPIFISKLEISGVHALEFIGRTQSFGFPSTVLTLTTLALGQILLRPEPSSVVQAQSLPQLVDLVIKHAHIEGSLDDFLITPKLERLCFHNVSWIKCRRALPIPYSSEPRTSKWKLPFQNVPRLKTLLLIRSSADEDLIEVLQNCHLLQHFSISQCFAAGFLQSFVSSLYDTDILPKLQLFDPVDSWYCKTVSYKEFRRRMREKRPQLAVKGNGHRIDEPAYDESDSENEDENEKKSGSVANVGSSSNQCDGLWFWDMIELCRRFQDGWEESWYGNTNDDFDRPSYRRGREVYSDMSEEDSEDEELISN